MLNDVQRPKEWAKRSKELEVKSQEELPNQLAKQQADWATEQVTLLQDKER